MTLKALLFDVDGTLADTEPHGHLPAWNRAFRELGLNWKWSRALYRKLLLQPGGRERVEYYIDAHNPDLGAHQDEVAANRGDWVRELHRVKSRHFRRRLKSGRVPLRPGVRRLMLEAAEADMKLAIVTNASRASLRPFLKHALSPELREHIDVVVSSEDVTHKKPAPDLYSQACAALDIRPDEAIAIEDSAVGMRSARAAGVPVVVTVNADTRHQDFSQSLLVVDHLGEADHPCRCLGGERRDDCPEPYVDLALLRRLAASAP